MEKMYAECGYNPPTYRPDAAPSSDALLKMRTGVGQRSGSGGGPPLGMRRQVPVSRPVSVKPDTGIGRTNPTIVAYKPRVNAGPPLEAGHSQGRQSQARGGVGHPNFAPTTDKNFYADRLLPSSSASGSSLRYAEPTPSKPAVASKPAGATGSANSSQPSSSRYPSTKPLLHKIGDPSSPSGNDRPDMSAAKGPAGRRKVMPNEKTASSSAASEGSDDEIEILPSGPTSSKAPSARDVIRNRYSKAEESEKSKGKKGQGVTTAANTTGKQKAMAAVMAVENKNRGKAVKVQRTNVARKRIDSEPGSDTDGASGCIVAEVDPLDCIVDNDMARRGEFAPSSSLPRTSLPASKSGSKAPSTKTKAASSSAKGQNKSLLVSDSEDDTQPPASSATVISKSQREPVRDKGYDEGDAFFARKEPTQEDIEAKEAAVMMDNVFGNLEKLDKAEAKEKVSKSKKQLAREEEFEKARLQMEEFEKAEAERSGRNSVQSSEDEFENFLGTPPLQAERDRKQREDLTCPFCGDALPKQADDEFYVLKTQLWDVSRTPRKSDKSKLRVIDLTKRIEFCTWHEALTTAVPAGKAAGYPDKIDFQGIPIRLEVDWIRTTLEGLAKFPTRSENFKLYGEMYDTKGMGWWKQAQLKNPAIISARSAGYYGAVGRSVIFEHLKNLLEWGYLPSIKHSSGGISRIDPLTPEEYIDNIMVPEAAILLIVSDQNKTSIMENGTAEEKAALRQQATKIWEESKEYGMWKFKESAVSAEILRDMKKGKREMEGRIREARKVPQKKNVEARSREIVKESEKVKKRSSDSSISVLTKPVKVRKLPREDDDNDPIIIYKARPSSSNSPTKSSHSAKQKAIICSPARKPKVKSKHWSSSPASTTGKGTLKVVSSSSSSSSYTRSNQSSTAVNDFMGDLTIKADSSSPVLQQAVTNIPDQPPGRLNTGIKGGGMASKKGFERTNSERSEYDDGTDWVAMLDLGLL